MSSVQSQLRRLPALAMLPDPTLRRLATASAMQHYAAGAVVVRAGSPQAHVAVISDGAIVIYRRNRENDVTVVLGMLHAPAVFGDAEAACGTPWTASARAEVDTTCVQIPIAAFMSAIRSDAGAAFALYTDANIRHLMVNHTVQLNSLYDVETRLLRLLLDYAHRYGGREADTAYVGRRLAQTEIAAALGVNRRTVIRAMKQMMTRGLLTTSEERGLVVHGLAAVEAKLPPNLLGLSASFGEAVMPIVSRWQAKLDSDD